MPGRVLVADRSVKVQKELTQLLTAAGIEVATVSNGEFAVRQLAKFQPDLVLADIFMPVRTGYEVCAHIKSDADTIHIPVLLLASKMEPYDEQRAALVGAEGKLEKPFEDLPTVLKKIQSYLPTVAKPRAAATTAGPAAETPAAVFDESPVTEAELFFSGPEPATLDETAAPLSFVGLLEEEPAAAETTAGDAEKLSLRRLDEAARAAARAKKLDQFLATYAPEAVVLPPDSSPLIGTAAVREYWSAFFTRPGFVLDWKPARFEVARLGDQAFALGSYKLTSQNPQGQSASAEGEYVNVFKKQPNGQWRIAAHIWNRKA